MSAFNPQYKVLITTSGIGSRLGKISRTLNKALVIVDSKTALTHIISLYPQNTQFVVTLGHLGNQVRDYLSTNYPRHRIEYIDVENYQGPGSSAGYSILRARPVLQCPFIFNACDTIVTGDIPKVEENWTGGNKLSHLPSSTILANFRTQTVKKGVVQRIQDIGDRNYQFVHIGLTGIRDYQAFWKTLSNLYILNPNNRSLTDTHVINSMIESGYIFKSVVFDTWLDTGTPSTLAHAREYFSTNHTNEAK